MSKTLKEAAADVLTGNVKSKRGEADKPQRLPGEVQDLGAPVVKPDTPTGPDASKGVSKDSSQSSQTGKHKAKVGAEKVHKMKNKQSVPMQEDEYYDDDEDILDEDEEFDDDENQIDELSKETLGKYIKKSSSNLASRTGRQSAFDAGSPYAYDGQDGNDSNVKKDAKNTDKILNRRKGIRTAVKKLTKESNDLSEDDNRIYGYERALERLYEEEAYLEYLGEADIDELLDEDFEYIDSLYHLEENDAMDYDYLAESLDEDDEGYDLPTVDDLDLDLSEDVAAMFEGQDLSEEFMDKAAFVFESAVRANLKRYEAELAEMFETSLNEAAEVIKEEMENEVDKYLSYVVEEWVQDNEVAIESGLRNELTEDFMSGLRNLFVEHYIDVPEEKVDVVESLSAKIDELENQLNESIENNANLHSVIRESAQERIFAEVTDGLTETQVDKLAELAESVDFDDEEIYAERLNTLLESYFPINRPKAARQLDEAIMNDPESNMMTEELTGPMAKYAAAIGKLKK